MALMRLSGVSTVAGRPPRDIQVFLGDLALAIGVDQRPAIAQFVRDEFGQSRADLVGLGVAGSMIDSGRFPEAQLLAIFAPAVDAGDEEAMILTLATSDGSDLQIGDAFRPGLTMPSMMARLSG